MAHWRWFLFQFDCGERGSLSWSTEGGSSVTKMFFFGLQAELVFCIWNYVCATAMGSIFYPVVVYIAVFNCTTIYCVINLVNLFKLFVCCSAIELAEAIRTFSLIFTKSVKNITDVKISKT